jgi:vacuolar iron transporter family protein
MPTAPHIGKHLTGSETVRDVVIGMADGLTYRLPSQQASRPLSLRPGSSPPLAWRRLWRAPSRWVLVAMAARTDQEHFASQERWEFAEVESLKDREVAEVKTIFEEYALIGETLCGCRPCSCSVP